MIPLRVMLGGPELLQGICQWVRCTLQLTYVGHRFAVSAAPTAPLFDPPLALQVSSRHLHVQSSPIPFCPTLANPGKQPVQSTLCPTHRPQLCMSCCCSHISLLVKWLCEAASLVGRRCPAVLLVQYSNGKAAKCTLLRHTLSLQGNLLLCRAFQYQFSL